MIRSIDKTALLFIIGGSFNTIVGYSAILAFRYFFSFSPSAANAAGYIVGMLVAYPVNKIFVFGDTRSSKKSAVRYVTAVAIAYSSNFAALHFSMGHFSVPEALAQAAGVVTYAVIFFLVSRYWVFSQEGFSDG